MGLAYADRVWETSITTGTGTLTLAGAIQGYEAFSTAFVTGQTVYYVIDDGANWEVGKGTYTLATTQLSRDTVFASSNAGALVNFPATTKRVGCDLPAQTIADKAMTAAFAMCAVSQ